MHKSGFINIIGNPNVGKSTLMNCFVGEKLSIISSKAQTTRHRILGIVNGADFQLVFSDTPGILKPSYELQEINILKYRTFGEVGGHAGGWVDTCSVLQCRRWAGVGAIYGQIVSGIYG